MSSTTYCDTHHEWLFDGEACKFCVVVKETEERIIKLLDDDFIYSIYGQPTAIIKESLIALIKGENK